MDKIENYDKKLNAIIEYDNYYYPGIPNIYRRKLKMRKFVFGTTKPEEFEYVLLGFGYDKTFVQENWRARRDLTHFKKVKKGQFQACCICTQGFVECCYIQNIDSKDIVRIGACCIRKIEIANGYKPILGDELKNSIIERKKFQHERECVLIRWCQKHKVKQDEKIQRMYDFQRYRRILRIL